MNQTCSPRYSKWLLFMRINIINWEGHEKDTSYFRIYNLNTSHLCAFCTARLKQEPQWLDQELNINKSSNLNRD